MIGELSGAGGFGVGAASLTSSWPGRGILRRTLRRVALAVCAGGMVGFAYAQGGAAFGGTAARVGPPERSVAEWLVRLQQASRTPAYTGTFVVSASGGAMSSSRIWHICEGNVQIDRVEALSGTPRTTYRRNESVVTFMPETRTVQTDQRESGGMFPNLLASGDQFATADFYSAREMGQGRVAGFDADIVMLKPRDGLRFGYRIWSEKQTGLVIKTQTLDTGGRVLEQAAFSELQLGAPVQSAKLLQMMANTDGYKVSKSSRVRTTPDAEGWAIKSPVAGFRAQNCYRKSGGASGAMVQWIFSDGLATVSLFMEPFDAQRHAEEGVSAMGATHTMMRRLPGNPTGWWVTAVGEVPPDTLKAFIDRLERKP